MEPFDNNEEIVQDAIFEEIPEETESEQTSEPVIVEEAIETAVPEVVPEAAPEVTETELEPFDEEEAEETEEYEDEKNNPILQGKYDLEDLYMDIGEEYCNMYSEAPDPSLAEKVSIVTELRRYLDERKKKIYSICGSPMTFLMVLLLTAQIGVLFVPGFNLETAIAMIPSAIICLGCWILFIQGLVKKVNSVGFVMINCVLTFLEIIIFIPLVLMLFLGFVMLNKGGADMHNASMVVIIGSIVAAFVNLFFFGGIKKTGSTAITIVTGKVVKWRAYLFPVIILVLTALINILFVAGLASGNIVFGDVLKNLSSYVDQFLGYEYVSKVLNELGNGTSIQFDIYTLSSSILGIIVDFLAAFTLLRIRSASKKKVKKVKKA